MRKVILMAAAVLMMAGCGFLKNSTTTNNTGATTQATTTTQTANTAVSAGQGAGTALQALYAQYKADGNKYNYKNMQNIINTMSLVSNCEGLKENYKDKTYLKEFGKGMVASSLGLVTQNNVETVTNSLVEMVKNKDYGTPVPNYVDENVSTKVVKLIQSYTGVVNKMVWRKS